MNYPQVSTSRPMAAPAESAADILWITYRWMSVGLAVTGVVAWFVSQSPAALELVLGNRAVFYGLLIAQLGLVFAFNGVAARASTAAAAAMFFVYAALTGVTFSVLFVVYTASSIAGTFAVSAGAFAGLSVFGAVTRRDLSSVGRFAIFALIGLIIASVVNIFLASTTLVWITTFAGVAIFGALTAYDTQKLLALYHRGEGGNLALRGALTLYLDFINMFLFLLRLFGRRR
ncbi:MAG: Bax inhibitor-1/YccA family protein [Deltaproteobacteria bacterium]|nr:Bax inhibitor-1/YccA family protein [Myxococcales bacterium]MDP3213403.1 Bax inhibitor-1/YccA family protein [Deltaproteobacteria bacterium]